MQTSQPLTADRQCALLSLLVAFVGYLRLLIFLPMPDSQLVQRIPDDAFYYLVPARNYAALGRWTFDGVEPATGFHLLWGYLLAGFFRLWPDASLHTILVAGSLLQVACLALAAWFAARTASRLFGPGALFGVALIFLSASCLQQATWLMETSFVILASAAMLFLLCRETITLTPAVAASSLLLGFGAMMARSDTGLLAFILFAMHAILRRSGRGSAAMLRAAAITLGGAILGLAAVLLHTHTISGHWIQSSAQQKAFWTHVAGYSLMYILHFTLSFFSPLYQATPLFTTNIWSGRLPHLVAAVIRIGLLAAIAWAIFKETRTERGTLARSVLLAMLSTVAGYIVFYGFDAAVQSWYIGNLAAPLALLTAAAAAFYTPRYRVVVVATALFMAVVGFTFSLPALIPWQEPMYRAGLYLAEHPELRPVASFNAGIIGFFSRNVVTNVDGLVNDSILPYSRRGTLAQYFAQRHIDYLLESPQVFTGKMPAEGGYADGRLEHCIQSSIDLFPDDPDNVYTGGRIRLYRLDPKCLAAAYR